jgi:hypothetical protein
MDYEYIRDEAGKITDIKVNGKPVKRGSMRGFRKAQETKYFVEIKNDHAFTNPFSGVTVMLNGLEATIYNWCMSWYSRYEYDSRKEKSDLSRAEAPVQTYDDMKYFLLEINAEAYMDLID